MNQLLPQLGDNWIIEGNYTYFVNLISYRTSNSDIEIIIDFNDDERILNMTERRKNTRIGQPIHLEVDDDVISEFEKSTVRWDMNNTATMLGNIYNSNKEKMITISSRDEMNKILDNPEKTFGLIKEYYE